MALGYQHTPVSCCFLQFDKKKNSQKKPHGTVSFEVQAQIKHGIALETARNGCRVWVPKAMKPTSPDTPVLTAVEPQRAAFLLPSVGSKVPTVLH